MATAGMCQRPLAGTCTGLLSASGGRAWVVQSRVGSPTGGCVSVGGVRQFSFPLWVERAFLLCTHCMGGKQIHLYYGRTKRDREVVLNMSHSGLRLLKVGKIAAVVRPTAAHLICSRRQRTAAPQDETASERNARAEQ